MTTFLTRPGFTKITRVLNNPGYNTPPVKDIVVPKRINIDPDAPTYGRSRTVWPCNYGIKIARPAVNFTQFRLAHTDIVAPDFTEFRRNSTKDPTKRNIDSIEERKLATYMCLGVGGVVAVYGTKQIIRTVVIMKSPGKASYALANTVVDISKIPEGKVQVVMWRGKPVFISHRRQKDIDRERAVDINQLRDPQLDEERVKDPKWLIMLASCTHLGCVPSPGQGSFNGWFCPCHGSHYDGSGRIRRGPAPLNLQIPDYCFIDENTLLIGSTNPKEG